MLNYRLVHTLAPDQPYAPQYLLLSRVTGSVCIIGTLYAAHLARSGRTRNSTHGELYGMAKLLTWSDETGEDIAASICAGVPPTLAQVHSLNAWLRRNAGLGFEGAQPSQARTLNATMSSIHRCIRWALLVGNAHRPNDMNLALQGLDTVWSEFGRITVGAISTAPDLTDEEIVKIETYLLDQMTRDDRPAALRDYLMWRMVMEYGIRVGEMLSLRVSDLPTQNKNFLEIVRIEHRPGGIQADPRTFPPSVKTLGRDLGQYFVNSSFPGLSNRYISECRWRWARRSNGSRFQQTRLGHNFLLITTKQGKPLSIASAQTRAQTISAETGIRFGWHVGRHSFFNRANIAMESIDDKFDREERFQGLKYWGGWNSDASFGIYTRKSRRDRAKKAGLTLGGHGVDGNRSK